MPYTKLPQSSHNVFLKRQQSNNHQQSHRGVGQDKSTTTRDRRASHQPASHEKRMRSHLLNSKASRSQIRPTPKRRTVPLTLWVNPIIKSEIQRIAEQEGISVSATGGAFIERGLQQNIDMQYSALLQPIIASEIRKNMRGISTRLALLLVRVAFDAGQTRSLVTNILGRQPGISPDMLKSILENSGKSAKGNITRKTPQLTELMEAVEQWLVAEDDEGDVSHD